MKKGSKSKRYEDMLNLMTLERWTLIFGIGIVLYYVLKASIVTYGPGGNIIEIKEDIILWYGIIVFFVLLLSEIVFTIVYFLTKRKLKKEV